LELFDDHHQAAHPVRRAPAVTETDLTGFSEIPFRGPKPVRSSESTEEEEAEMERRLRGLGYIS